MASYEVRCSHQVSAADRIVAEAEVRAGESARLLRVVGEVSLAIFVGVVTDNLHGVLVCTYGTVGSEAIELGLEHTLAAESYFFFLRERSESYVIDDAEGEFVLWHRQCKVLVNREDLCRSGILRTKTEAATYDKRSILLAVEAVLNVEIERLAVCARFLGAVEHSDALGSGRHCSEEVLSREWTVEVNRNQTNLFALGSEVVDSFADSLSN